MPELAGVTFRCVPEWAQSNIHSFDDAVRADQQRLWNR